MYPMANTKPQRLVENLHMRVEPEFLAKLDDLRRRGEGGPIPSRSDVLRKLVEDAHAAPAKRRKARA